MDVRKILPKPIKDALWQAWQDTLVFLLRCKVKRRMASRRLSNDDPFHMVMLVVYPQMWNTFKPLYDEARSRDLRVTIIAMPRLRDGVFDSGEEARSFFAGCEIPFIDAVDEDGQWVDLRSLEPTHVFYMRPYIEEYPKAYQPVSVSAYAYTCLLPYAEAPAMSSYYDIGFNEKFLIGVNYVFTGRAPVCDALISDYASYVAGGWMKITLVPDPRIEVSLEAFEEGVPNNQNFTIVYTPRWAVRDNPNLTTFFDYLRPLMGYVESHEGTRLILRPHPLAFECFIREGKATEDELESLVKMMDEDERYTYEADGDYLSSFIRADVMLSDFSSLVHEFCLSGKPVLYTDDPSTIQGVFHDVYGSFYRVSNWEEIEHILDELRAGSDSKSEERASALNKVIEPRKKCGDVVLDVLLHK